MSAQLAAMMSMFGGPSAGSTEGGMPDMQNLFAQMMGGGNPGGPNLLGDLNDPAGLGGGGGGGGDFPPNMFGNGGFPAFPGMPAATSQKRSKVERFFPLIHAVSILVFLVFVAVWWEPSVRSSRWPGQLEQGLAGRWAALSGRRGVWRGVKDDLLGGVAGLVSS